MAYELIWHRAPVASAADRLQQSNVIISLCLSCSPLITTAQDLILQSLSSYGPLLFYLVLLCEICNVTHHLDTVTLFLICHLIIEMQHFPLTGSVTVFGRNTPVTFQALSEGDRKLWMEAMDGKEPVSSFLVSPCWWLSCSFIWPLLELVCGSAEYYMLCHRCFSHGMQLVG